MNEDFNGIYLLHLVRVDFEIKLHDDLNCRRTCFHNKSLSLRHFLEGEQTIDRRALSFVSSALPSTPLRSNGFD